MSALRRTDMEYHPEPSRYIYISGLRNPRPLNELRHWFSRGRYIYDELRCPVVPTSVAGQGPDRLSTASSGAHPVWEDTLNEEVPGKAHQHLKAQFDEIQRVEDAIALEEEERKVAEEEEDRLDEKEMRKKAIRAKTWTGSRGKYGNEATAMPHAFPGRGVQHVAQHLTPSHSPSPFAPAIEYPMDAYAPHQAQRFQPFSGPADTFMPSFVNPAYAAIQNDVAFNEAVYSMEQQILRSPPQPFPLLLNHVDDQSASWASPAPTPAMSVLSPRAAAFVPAGLFSPEMYHGVPAPLMGTYAGPGAGMSERQLSQQSTISTQQSTVGTQRSGLNPAAGDFEPGAAPPTGQQSQERDSE